MKTLFNENITWIPVSDHNIELRKIADRHYSRKTKGAKKFIGPEEYLALITPEGKAGYIWRKSKIEYRKDGQEGIECTLFRNEGPEIYLSSKLILEAEKLALEKWKETKRFFTYINPEKIKSTYPGFTFIKAGYKTIGRNKTEKLIILEKEVNNE